MLWGNARPSAGPWGTAAMVDPNTTTIGTASVAVLSTGDVLAVWGEQNVYAIWATHVSGGVPIASRIDDPATAGDPYNPRIAVDAADDAVVVWQDFPQYGGTHFHIWTNRFTPAAGWGTATAVDSATEVGQFASDPDIAVDAGGNAIVVWDQVNTATSTSDVWANRYIADVGWGAAQDLGPGSQPRIAIDPAGDATVVSRGLGVTAFRYVHGVGWQLPQPLVADGVNGNDPPSVAVDQRGDVVAVWEVFGATLATESIWASRYVPDVGWGPSMQIGRSDDYEADAVVVIDPMGNATALWDTGSTSLVITIWANTMR